MSNATDQAIEKLTAAIEAGIKGIGVLGEKYGPEVIDAALWVVRINGLANLATGIALGAVAFGLYRLNVFLWALRDRTMKARRPHSGDDDGDGAAVGAILCLAGTAISGAVSIVFLANVWNYVSIVEPKFWIAKRLLGL